MANPSAYNGNEPYIFISYAHKDSDKVLPIIRELQSRGYRVWYDAGIEAGTEWPEYIAARLMNSRCVITFISKAAINSSHCRQEITFAVSKKKEMLTVYLDDTPLPPGLELQLGINQAMFYNRSGSAVSLAAQIAKASMFDPCKSGAPPVRTAPPRVTPTQVTPPPVAKPAPRRRRNTKLPLFIGLGIAGVVVLGLLGGLLQKALSGGLPSLGGSNSGTVTPANAKKGDIVQFGSYEQNNDQSDGVEPISWIVLHVEDGKLLLLSQNGLDSQPYHEDGGETTWEDCSLRQWLNDDFYNEAFTTEEQAQLCLTALTTDGSKDTRDYVFSLTEAEAELYREVFSYVELTEYARQEGATSREWWLRAPWNASGTLEMDYGLAVFDNDNDITMRKTETTGIAVRPCIWLDIRTESEKDTLYNKALSLMDEKSYKKALEAFQSLGDYKDSVSYCEKLPRLMLVAPYVDATVGSEVDFGSHEWIILDKQANKVLLLSKYALETKDFHSYTLADPGWADCSLREWLNDEFYTRKLGASPEEMTLILPTVVSTEPNAEYESTGGPDSTDRLFLLSHKEVTQYLPAPSDCLAYTKDGSVPVMWWLRSKGKTTNYAMFVDDYGYCNMVGAGIFQLDSPYYVRPAMWINVEA